MKLVDPTRPFAEIAARRRRDRAATDAATFGLWTATHDWRSVYPDPTVIAGIGASEQGLREPERDLTQQLLGASGGLLVDLGFQVCPIGAVARGLFRPSLLVWLAGENTPGEELVVLASFGAPGLWIGERRHAIDGWAHVEPDVFEDRVRFVREFVAAVASVVDIPEAACRPG